MLGSGDTRRQVGVTSESQADAQRERNACRPGRKPDRLCDRSPLGFLVVVGFPQIPLNGLAPLTVFRFLHLHQNFYEAGLNERGLMAVSLVRSSRFLRSLVLTVWVFSLLLWLYIVVRIVVNGVDVHTAFVDSIPGVSFSAVGVFSFGLSFLGMFTYLWIWGRFDRMRPMQFGLGEREP